MDPEAFERIYQRHFNRVYRYSLGMTGNVGLAEDVTQEAFYRLLQDGAGASRVVNPLAWLIRVARNLALDLFSRGDVPAVPVIRHDPTPEDSLRLRSMRKQILDSVSQLSARQRDCIALREFGGFSYREISETLGISLDEVRVQLHRARRNLRSKLEDWL